MRTRLVMGAVAMGITAAFAIAPAASAGAIPYIKIQQQEIRAGDDVTIEAWCATEHYKGSDVVSDVLTAGRLQPTSTEGTRLPIFTKGHVKEGTKPGRYELSFLCGFRTSEPTFGSFEVLPGGKPAPPTTSKPVPPTSKPPVKEPAAPQVVKPKGAAETGGGGTAGQ
jgi:hypothetical protein